jgi:hypothetical protein
MGPGKLGVAGTAAAGWAPPGQPPAFLLRGPPPDHHPAPATSPPAQELEALQAQEAANKRASAPGGAGADAAPPPGAEREAAGAAPHAAPVNELDEALAREGVTGYKALLAAGQNASHIAGADVEGGVLEFETVADKLNFDVNGAGRGEGGRLGQRFGTALLLGQLLGQPLRLGPTQRACAARRHAQRGGATGRPNPEPTHLTLPPTPPTPTPRIPLPPPQIMKRLYRRFFVGVAVYFLASICESKGPGAGGGHV